MTDLGAVIVNFIVMLIAGLNAFFITHELHRELNMSFYVVSVGALFVVGKWYGICWTKTLERIKKDFRKQYPEEAKLAFDE
jgi:hypothetical protein